MRRVKNARTRCALPRRAQPAAATDASGWRAQPSEHRLCPARRKRRSACDGTPLARRADEAIDARRFVIKTISRVFLCLGCTFATAVIAAGFERGLGDCATIADDGD